MASVTTKIVVILSSVQNSSNFANNKKIDKNRIVHLSNGVAYLFTGEMNTCYVKNYHVLFS